MRIIVFTGSGISAESGIKTFRDSGGLWENHRIEDVATPMAWSRNPKLVLDFYNQRRRQVHLAEPNAAHKAITRLQDFFDVHVITQNVDDLHERAGSEKVLHLHGEIKKARSTIDPDFVIQIDGMDLNFGDLCPKGSQMRPHIVWFGEDVPEYRTALTLVQRADLVMVVGTSLNVYPAAGLVREMSPGVPCYVIDPNASDLPNTAFYHRFDEVATKGVPFVVDKLINEHTHA